MNYTVAIDGFEGQRIEVQPAGLFSGPKLLVNGQPAPKGSKRGQMLLRRNDGQEVTAAWKPMIWDLPQIVVDGRAIALVKPLAWYEWIWCGLPLLLVMLGGALGGLAGFIGFSINTKIFRSNLKGWFARYLLAGLVSAATVVIYFIQATLLVSAIGQS